MFYLYEQGFRYFDMGYASAIAYLLFAIVMLASLAQSRLFKSKVDA